MYLVVGATGIRRPSISIGATGANEARSDGPRGRGWVSCGALSRAGPGLHQPARHGVHLGSRILQASTAL
jgi:hypothetical protein